MEKRIRASAIIFIGDKLITVYREKIVDGVLKKYYTIPGGGVEDSESIEDAAKREILEEVGINIDLTDKYFYMEDEKSKQYFYHSLYVSGEIGTGAGPEFTDRDREKYGLYEVRLVDKNKICDINLLPKEVKDYILNTLC